MRRYIQVRLKLPLPILVLLVVVFSTLTAYAAGYQSRPTALGFCCVQGQYVSTWTVWPPCLLGTTTFNPRNGAICP